MALVSVVIPVYNAEKYLRRMLESVLNQTFTDIEVILVNDGSNDNSEKICYEYKRRDARFYLTSQHNQGVSSARNLGISLSHGEYILFCDSDDEIRNDYIECLVKQVQESDADLCICPFIRIHGRKYTFELLEQFCVDLDNLSSDDKIHFFDLARLYLIYGPCNKIFKSSIIKDNDLKFMVDISYGEDLLFVFSYLDHCHKVSYYPYSFYLYYSNEGSLLYKYRHDRFDNSVRINNCVRDFFIRSGLMTSNMQREWSERIFNEAIGSIGDLFNEKCALSEIKKILMIQHIVSDSNTVEAIKYLNSGISNGVYFRMIKSKLFLLIYMRKKVAQVVKKLRGNK